MSVRIKFGDCIPFPDKPGIYTRLVTGDSPEKENSVVIVQGHVMRFHSEGVTLLDKGQESTAEVVRAGDQLCIDNGLVVSYVPIVGIGVTRRTGGPTIIPGTDSNGRIPPEILRG